MNENKNENVNVGLNFIILMLLICLGGYFCLAGMDEVETKSVKTSTKSAKTKKSKKKSSSKKKSVWTETSTLYTSENVELLARLIYAEDRNDKTDQLYIGSVVLNRVKSKKYPNTIKGVISQKGQYSTYRNGTMYKLTPSKQAYKVARRLLKNGSVLPSKVVYQANFRQGKGVYKKYKTKTGAIMYYCY